MKKSYWFIVVIIAALVGGAIYTGRTQKIKDLVCSFTAERDAYRAHHKPTAGWYYSVEAISTEPTSGKTFIIGRNMQPKMSTARDGSVSISLEPNGKLEEVEVPNKTAGLKTSGIYFTVSNVNGIPTLIYFPSDREVVVHMLRTCENKTP